jgi:hypothetical protein
MPTEAVFPRQIVVKRILERVRAAVKLKVYLGTYLPRV